MAPLCYAPEMPSSGRRLEFDRLARMAGVAMPWPLLRAALGQALRGQSAALCLHRVRAQPRGSDWQPGLAIAPEVLSSLVELLLSVRPGPSAGWLTVSFDDGYADAVEWVRQSAPRFPGVEFLCFVCPEKVTTRAGFRWDLVEVSLQRGLSRDAALAQLDAPFSLAAENQRPELLALGDHPDFRLATVEELRAAAALPNVRLGNHTNLHGVATRLGAQVFEEDARASTAQFERLFGLPRHFAFPYGTPQHQFDASHVEALRRLGTFVTWSTEARTYAPRERLPGAVLPRFPVDGRRALAEQAGWILARALRGRVKRWSAR